MSDFFEKFIAKFFPLCCIGERDEGDVHFNTGKRKELVRIQKEDEKIEMERLSAMVEKELSGLRETKKEKQVEETKQDIPAYNEDQQLLKSQLKELAEEKFRELEPLVGSSIEGYTEILKNDEHIKAYTKIIDYVSKRSKKTRKLAIYRMSYDIDVSIEEWQDHTVNVERQAKLSKMEKTHRINLFHYEDGSEIHLGYFKTKKVPIIANSRDFVYIKMIKRTKENVFQVTRSVNHPEYPKDKTGQVVRGKIYSNILRFTPIDGTLETASKFHVDTYNITCARVSVNPVFVRPIVAKEMKDFYYNTMKEIKAERNEKKEKESIQEGGKPIENKIITESRVE